MPSSSSKRQHGLFVLLWLVVGSAFITAATANSNQDGWNGAASANPPPTYYDYNDNEQSLVTEPYDASKGQSPPPPPPPLQDYDDDRPPPPTTGRDGSFYVPPPERAIESQDGYYNDRDYGYTQQPPPPPPPGRLPDPSSSQSSTTSTIPKAPIHYEFPMAATASSMDDEEDSAVFVPENADLDVDVAIDDERGRRRPPPGPRASPRQDLITRYMSTTSGKLQVHLSSAMVGGSTGIFLAKSLLPFAGGSSLVWGVMGAMTWLISSLMLRTPFGELVRAVALAIILVLQRTHRIRRQYPTWRYVPGALFRYSAGGDRRPRHLPPPFPPARNPWRYTPRGPQDVEFNMMYSTIAMAMVGSTCGGNLPMIPTWMGSLAGSATFALGCTLTNSPRGDLCRTLGMRVVALVQELWDIQAQLGIVPKAAIVSSQILDRIMILDRQHKVKDRFLRVVNAGYEQVLKTASRVQEERLDAQGRGSTRREKDDNADYNDESRRGRRPREDFRDNDRNRARARGRDDENDEDSNYRNRRPPSDRRESPTRGSGRGPPRDDFRDPSSSDRRRPNEDDNDWPPRGPPRDDGQREDLPGLDQDRSPPKRGWFGR